MGIGSKDHILSSKDSASIAIQSWTVLQELCEILYIVKLLLTDGALIVTGIFFNTLEIFFILLL